MSKSSKPSQYFKKIKTFLRALLSAPFAQKIFHFTKQIGITEKNVFKLKPFGITIEKEIDNLILDLIHRILQDYNLKSKRKFKWLQIQANFTDCCFRL